VKERDGMEDLHDAPTKLHQGRSWGKGGEKGGTSSDWTESRCDAVGAGEWFGFRLGTVSHREKLQQSVLHIPELPKKGGWVEGKENRKSNGL